MWPKKKWPRSRGFTDDDVQPDDPCRQQYACSDHSFWHQQSRFMIDLSPANQICHMEILLENRLLFGPFGIPLLFVSTTLSAQIVASEVPEANPARPTVSTPATLTPAGYLQFENGGLFAAHSPEFSR
jgi:hypothetical protein